jgi:hypothetical protein
MTLRISFGSELRCWIELVTNDCVLYLTLCMSWGVLSYVCSIVLRRIVTYRAL